MQSRGLFATIRAAMIALGVSLTLGAPARAVEPGEMLKDPAQEGRARALSSELRCLVCQNQSIDDSDAQLAHELRLIVRQRIVAGDSDEEIKRFLVDRFGTFVLLRPPFGAETLLLWLLPFLALGIGAFAAFRLRALRADKADEPPLDQVEEARLKALLDEHG